MSTVNPAPSRPAAELDLLSPVDAVELPEPLADVLDGVLPEAVDGWLARLPLPSHRVTGSIRRDRPQDQVECLVVNLSRHSLDRVTPEDAVERDGYRVAQTQRDTPPDELGAAAIASRERLR